MSVGFLVRRASAVLAGALSVTLALALAGPATALAARTPSFRPPGPQWIPAVPVRPVSTKPRPADPATMAAARPVPSPTWPAAGVAVVDVPVATAPRTATARAGSLPVSVGRAALSGGPGRVRVEMLDHARALAAGVNGLLLNVSRADGGTTHTRVPVSVDYRAFRTAYGGDWANRLRLVRLDGCDAAGAAGGAGTGCRAVLLASHNDLSAGRVTAEVDLSPPATATQRRSPDIEATSAPRTLIALTADSSGSAGSFSATSLSASSTWSGGGSGGDFSWSYPIHVPPAPGGPVPDVTLAYSAQSVDGRTAATNNQPSAIGEGFEYASGFIERRYKSCSEDMGGSANNTTKTGDQCWATDNAVLSLNGHAGELIRDGNGLWHLRSDDGSRIERFTGGANGDNDGEYWRVTTPNGTQYWFGRSRLPGWTAGRPETQSAQTFPVFGNNPGEPCHQATFAASSCTQAYRWNLDYVVDVYNSSMSFWYSPETNYYARNGNTAQSVPYIRSASLWRIDYGTRADPDPVSGTDSALTGNPPAHVLFNLVDRCLSGCATHDAAHWPDTPYDQECTAGATCYTASPTFWSTRRLASVTTEVWDAATSRYRPVDTYQLRQTFPDPGDGTRAGLWLAGITHTGLVGGSLSMPEVTFDGAQLANRVDAIDNSPAMRWWRIAAIHTESGGMISVTYSDPDCVAGSRMPTSSESNEYRCYPVKWTPEGLSQPIVDWFHKYVVTSVLETDLTGGSPAVVTQYTYQGAPAWHYTDDDGLVPEGYRTWSQWRGYGKVGVTKGYPGEQTYAETLFFRGMNGDHLPNGTRSVSVQDSQGGTWPDDEAFVGMTREQISYNGPSIEVSATISDPWSSAPTASRTIGTTTVNARFVRTHALHARVALDGGRGYRRATSISEFDGSGQVTQTEDQGDDNDPDDSRCIKYTLASNAAAWLIDYPVRAQSYALPCGQSPSAAEDIISDNRTYYDGQAFGAAPVKGDPTQLEALRDWSSSGGPVYTATSRAAFDAAGRLTDNWDAAGKHTSTAYTPTLGGPVTKVTVTNPLGHVAVTDLEPASGMTVRSTDANGKVTSVAYDPLNRVTGIWLPGQTMGVDSPSASATYLIRTDGVVATSTSRLGPNGNYITTYALYDSLLRPRQSQQASPLGGRIVTDTAYDSEGRVVRTVGPYHAAGSPDVNLVAPTDLRQVPTQTVTLYDAAGRVTASVFKPYDQERWRTTTYYGGDHADVTPPTGGYAQSTYTNARGQTVQLRQHQSNQPGGAYDATAYRYDRRGYLASVTDSAGNQWSFGYDIRGRQVSTTDPDVGTSITAYSDTNQILSTTDGRGQKLSYSYDGLGRRTAVFDAVGTKLAAWTYDTLAKGHPTSSARYVNGNAYTVAVRGYTDRYEPTGVTVTIPTVEGLLAGTYRFQATYNADGSPATTSFPKAGGLEAETLSYTYDDLGEAKTVSTFYGLTNGTYVTDTAYDALGDLSQYRLSTGTGGNVYQSLSYELETGRLTGIQVSRDSRTPNVVFDVRYDHDAFGNITRVADGRSGDVQCFTQDYLYRLTHAWTPGNGDCSPAPDTATLGGPAPYWLSWTYDKTGNRRSQVDHAGPLGTATTTYTYPEAGSAHPHAATETSTSDSSGTSTATFGYDAAGNTTSRPGAGGGTQALTWNVEGRLDTVTDGGATTRFTYTADGDRLIRRDATGSTLYLPGMELRLTGTTGPVTATRYYGSVAMRTTNGVIWLASDPQGTAQATIDPASQQESVRRQTPFGAPRGTQPNWPDSHGFLGGDKDPTGLTHLGAREYDPARGRFISADPVADFSNPQQVNGYAYANNNPVNDSDPSGLLASVTPTFGAGEGPVGLGCGYWADEAKSFECTHPKDEWMCQTQECSDDTDRYLARHDRHMRQTFKHTLVTIAVVAASIVCDAVTAGAGALFCQGVAGGLGSLADYLIDTDKDKWNVEDGAKAFAKGMAYGLLMAGGAKLVGALIGKIAKAFRMAGKAEDAAGGIVASEEAESAANRLRGETDADNIKPGTRTTPKAEHDPAPPGESGSGSGGGSGGRSGGGSGGKSEPSCAHSFDPATPVLMADGTTKPIQDVKVGDEVLATAPDTGETGARQVTAVHRNQDSDLADVIVTDANGSTETLHTTQHHPFWDSASRSWVQAADLQTGHPLGKVGGRIGYVAEVHAFAGNREMRDLTVDSIHTYYVLAGKTPVLVHNTNGCPPFVPGQDFRHSFDTSAGEIRFSSEVVADGTTLWLRDVVVAPARGSSMSWDSLRGTLGPGEVMDILRNQMGSQAASQGYTHLRLTGIRVTGPEGHVVDFTIPLR